MERLQVFALICAAFGTGAAVGAYVTKRFPASALGLPVLLLVMALLRCEQMEARAAQD